MNGALGFEIELAVPFEAAIEQVTAALKAEGFGVLTRVDLHDAFRHKLNLDFRPYAILGACNPHLAHQAVSVRPEIGLLLPCNVTVEAAGEGRSLVRIVDPKSMMAAGGLDADPAIGAVGEQAHDRLQRVASALKRGGR